MIGLDTNVLVRHLTQDDASQAAMVARVIDKATAGSLFISTIVLCEVVWVLRDIYDRKREQIEDVVEKILLSEQFAFENKNVLWQALSDFRRGKDDFADYVISRLAQAAGCSHTLTFDRAHKSDRLFQVL